MMGLLSAVLLFLLAVRSLRWLALAQQKEYRADRLWLYVQSPEGLEDLLRVVPRWSDLSRTGLKRPRITPRVLVVAASYGLIWFLCALAAQLHLRPMLAEARWELFSYSAVALGVWLVPVLIGLSILPSTFVSLLSTRRMLQRAQQALQAHQPLIIGITGSYGKSSTKHLLAHVLRERYSVFTTPKSFNTRYSVALSIVQGYTNQSIAILEYGAYGPREIAALTKWFIPKIALVTGLTKQHLGLFGSLDGIVEAKSELVAAVPGNGSVFFNDEDSQVERIVKRGLERNSSGSGLRVVPAGSSDAVKSWSEPRLNKSGQLEFRWGSQKIKTKLVGLHYYSLLKVVASVAGSLDVSDEAIVHAIQTFVPPNGFISAFETKTGAIVIDDGGTSNPQGFAAAIALAASLKPKRAILITPGIIDLGDEERQIHDQLAAQAREVFDIVWYLGAAGKASFREQFGDALVDDRELISDALLRLDRDTMVVVEGRMPGWLLWHLNQIKK